VSHKSRRVGWMALAAASIAMMVVVVHWPLHRDGTAAAPRVIAPVPDSVQPTQRPVRIDAGDTVTPATRDVIAADMLGSDDFAHDIMFLLASSLRSRCDPEQAHDLPRMVIQAHLSVLHGVAATLGSNTALRPQLYTLVQRLVSMAPCHRSLAITIGAYHAQLDPSRYAAAFPDSYFDPTLAQPPEEFAGHALHERVEDPCTSIGYAVLPLGLEGRWQCATLRADARRHLVLDTCAAVLKRLPPPGGKALQSAAAQQQLAVAIHAEIGKLPAMCR
jgi:hypothetical protein